jgi:UDP-N-acetylmuramate: L-alanyl-gamma-D-glutamyl-meso-diaminopimelate ligase
MRIHFIAIGGSAMHNMAIALHKKGFKVTGSDDVLFEPSVSRLSKHGLFPEKEGWYPENITPDIDAVILGMHARADNPELLKAQELGLKIYSYPEYIYEHSKNKLRVVIGGSHGKTTITSMILHVLKNTGKDFDYLVGAQLEGFDTMVKLTDEAPVIVIEGDEYLSSAIDRRPKFKLFIDTIQPGGKLIYSETDTVLNDLVKSDDSEVEKFPYSLPAYNIKYGITNIIAGQKEYQLQVFGEHNLLNMEAARIVCENLGIKTEDFYTQMSSFKGAARRLELVGKNGSSEFFKDFAHSPSKLTATIHAVKTQFPDRKLIACIELHTFSSLNKDFLSQYAHTMDEADIAFVFIDKKTFEQKKMAPYAAETVKDAFAREDLVFYNDPAELQKRLENIVMKDTNLLMMSSGNFGGINLPSLAEKIL